MDMDGSPLSHTSSAPISVVSPVATTAAGYIFNTLAHTQSLETRSAVGTQENPWLRTANRVVAGVGIGISTSLLIMRVYTKARIMRKFWWDDFFIILAWVFSVACQGVILYGWVYSEYGVHFRNLNPSALPIYPKTMLAASILYIPALACAKLAILMFYYALLSVVQFWKNVIYVVSTIIMSYSIALFFALLFACHPIQKTWDGPSATTEGSCISRPGVYLAITSLNTLSDIILILIPIPTIRRLHVQTTQKLGIAALFGIGCLTIITSIVRLATLWPLVKSSDQVYEMGLAALLVFIEGNFIIICGCLPYLRQFLRRHAPKLIGYESNESSSSDSRYQSKGAFCRRVELNTNATTASVPAQRTEEPSSNQEVIYMV